MLTHEIMAFSMYNNEKAINKWASFLYFTVVLLFFIDLSLLIHHLFVASPSVNVQILQSSGNSPIYAIS